MIKKEKNYREKEKNCGVKGEISWRKKGKNVEKNCEKKGKNVEKFFRKKLLTKRRKIMEKKDKIYVEKGENF